ncbi:MAG: Asp-tRNA(Asn)/Glu-tRNA(Gln) amidotransferase subunit GatB [Patescibacteria group bacterium]
MKYDVIIGLEIHAELKTKSKMFCSCDNNSEKAKPNTNVCPICLGHPGTLPLPNHEAINFTLLTGLALHCKINRFSKFDRKNYFYPDLPKGYQISQYDLPLCYEGYLEVNDEKVLITRIHLEEDTGKSAHFKQEDYSLLDFNRAGTPLMELVTEPVIKDASEAKKFCQNYQQILRYLDISNADMEKGEMRCEANISLQGKGKWAYKKGLIMPTKKNKLNPKVEVKNINSFRSVEKAINFEIKRQEMALENGEEIIAETRGFDENKGETVSQRVKENSADYRYFPEPDIPPLNISEEWLEELYNKLPEMPQEKTKRFMKEYGLNENIAEVLTNDKELSEWTENVISELNAWIEANGDEAVRQEKHLARSAANLITSELLKHLNSDNKKISDLKITAENFAELCCLLYQNKINSSAGQSILEKMYKEGGDPTDIMGELGLEQIDDSVELEIAVKKIIAKNPAQTADYKKGKITLIQFFIGQVMAETKGKANPERVKEILERLLSN